MATFYGSWKYRDGFYGQRLILDLSRSGSTVKYTLKIQSTGSMYANVPYSVSGSTSASGTKSVSHGSAFTATLRSGSFTNANAVTVKGSASVFWGGSLSVSGSLASRLPKPGAPTNIRLERTQTDIDNATGTVKWTKGSNATSTRITASEGNNAWYTLGTSSGTSLSVVNFRWNTRYRFNGVSTNSSGSSVEAGATGPYYTKPSTPTNVVATVGSGTSVDVSFTNNAKYKYGVEIKTSTGLTYSYGNGTSGTVADTYTIEPGVGDDIRFSVRSFAGPSTDRAYSNWSAWSNPVVTLRAPNPPTNVAPNGTIVSNQLEDNIRISWKHNPADGTSQTGWKIRIREFGASTWPTVYTRYSSSSSAVLDDQIWGSFIACGMVEFQMATQGKLSGAWSEWSESSIVTTSDLPVVNITYPPVGYCNSNRATVSWEVDSPYPQTGFTATLRKNDEVLEVRRGSTASSVQFTTELENWSLYYIDVQAKVSDSLWSDVTISSFQTEFIPPGEATVHAEYNPGRGYAELDIRPTAETSYFTIERSCCGHEYSLIRTNQTGNVIINDHECLVNGTTYYKITSYSDIGATSVVTTEVTAAPDCLASSVELGKSAAYLAPGDSFSDVLVFPYKLERARKVALERSVQYYAGRTYPVSYFGNSIKDTFTIGGLLKTGRFAEGVTEEDLIRVVTTPAAVFLYRDTEGHHVYCAIGELSMDRKSPNITTWSLELHALGRQNNMIGSDLGDQ